MTCKVDYVQVDQIKTRFDQAKYEEKIKKSRSNILNIINYISKLSINLMI